MAIIDNRELVRRFIEGVWGKADMDLADQIIASDLIDHTPVSGVPGNREGYKQLVHALHTAFPDLSLSLDRVIVDGDVAVDYWTCRGTHQGEFMNVAPSGKPVTFSGIDILKIEDGQIVETWHIEELLQLVQQITSKD
jgi:steroid delta-isomerase-like uncharacterized protein